MRLLYLSSKQVIHWFQGTLYEVTADDIVPVTTATLSSTPHLFYEVTPIEGVGSWWVPTAPKIHTPSLWQQYQLDPIIATTTNIATYTSNEGEFVRPTTLFWWIPSTAWPHPDYTPAIINGTLNGRFPQHPPQTTPTKTKTAVSPPIPITDPDTPCPSPTPSQVTNPPQFSNDLTATSQWLTTPTETNSFTNE